jgi:hypothetical protein
MSKTFRSDQLAQQEIERSESCEFDLLDLSLLNGTVWLADFPMQGLVFRRRCRCAIGPVFVIQTHGLDK